MQNYSSLIVELLKKISLKKGSEKVEMAFSAIEAFLSFCNLQKNKGLDIIQEHGLEPILKSLYQSKGRNFDWKPFTSIINKSTKQNNSNFSNEKDSLINKKCNCFILL